MAVEPRPGQMTGALVRVMCLDGSIFIGYCTRMESTPTGVVCSVAANGRRIQAPRQLVTFAEPGDVPSGLGVNVHKGADVISGQRDIDEPKEEL